MNVRQVLVVTIFQLPVGQAQVVDWLSVGKYLSSVAGISVK